MDKWRMWWEVNLGYFFPLRLLSMMLLGYILKKKVVLGFAPPHFGSLKIPTFK